MGAKCALTSPGVSDFPEGQCGCANHTIASLLHRIISSPAARRLGILAVFLSDVRHTLRENGLYTFY